jgi:hypothetical protein
MIEAMAGNVPHEIAVVGFDSGPELLQDFTTNMDSVADTIRDLCANIDGDGGAAILDSLGFALDLLGKQPRQYRRAILLLSETNDRGSKLKLDDALRAVSDTNTAIYSIAYSTGNTDAAQYAHRELPTKSKPCKADDQLCALLIEMENSHNIAERIVGVTLKTSFYSVRLENDIPNPPHGCMGKDLNPAPNASRSKFSQFYDCLGQLAPPLLIARVAVIETTEGLQRNIPETVAHLTGGEYFKLSDAKSLEQSLATISNHIPNRYVLSFQPQSPHPGFHFITLELPNHVDLQVSARNGYWADTTASSTAPHP